nr:MAG TPA: hypothetical protein [Caudoviricetes sp.]
MLIKSIKSRKFGGGVLLEIYLKILLIVSYTLRKMEVRSTSERSHLVCL